MDEERASKILAEEQLEIEVDLGLGGGFEARYFTCDFSYDYVRYHRFLKTVLTVVSMEVTGRRGRRGSEFDSRSKKCINTVTTSIIVKASIASFFSYSTL